MRTMGGDRSMRAIPRLVGTGPQESRTVISFEFSEDAVAAVALFEALLSPVRAYGAPAQCLKNYDGCDSVFAKLE